MNDRNVSRAVIAFPHDPRPALLSLERCENIKSLWQELSSALYHQGDAIAVSQLMRFAKSETDRPKVERELTAITYMRRASVDAARDAVALLTGVSRLDGG